MMGRPPIFDEPATRLWVTVPQSLNAKVRAAGHDVSRLVSATLDAFLKKGNDKAALLEERLRLATAIHELERVALRTTSERNDLARELHAIRQELANQSRAVRLEMRSAPKPLIRHYSDLYRRVRLVIGDTDAHLRDVGG